MRGQREAVFATLQEGQGFIEWIASEMEMKKDRAERVRLQVQLAIWQIQSISNGMISTGARN